MNELALFAGAGGGILGGVLLGWRTVAAVEIEEYPRAVLLQRQADGCLPRFPIWDDVRTFDGHPWRGRVDVITGGFPCQDISAAGKGAGITGERSGLWSEFARIIGEVRPRYAFVENSPMLTIRGLGRVLGDLSEMGYDAEWCVLGAKEIGGAINSERLWLLASKTSSIRLDEMDKIQKRKRFECNVWDARKLTAILDTLEVWEGSKRGSEYLVNGMASYVDESKAVGNGQIPIVAATAWNIMIDRVNPGASANVR
jgi:DNA (cytosine-5)-methyltransferase 1